LLFVHKFLQLPYKLQQLIKELCALSYPFKIG
jgi:hypothetical protein